MERKFAPPDDRLRSLVAREKQMPALLAAARAISRTRRTSSPKSPSSSCPDIISFFQNDVPQPSPTPTDPALKAEFAQSNAAVICRAQELSRLAQDRPARRAPTATSASAPIPSQKKLAVRRDGRYAARQAARNRLGRSAQEPGPLQASRRTNSSPTKTPRAVLEELGEDHPAPDQLLDAFRATFNSLVGFIRDASHRHHSRPMCAPSSKKRRLHARHHVRQHGHARPLRDPRHRSLLQRHAARPIHDAA